MDNSFYNPQVLRELVECSGLSLDDIARATKIAIDVLKLYLKDYLPVIPNTQNAVKLADFFAVPLDLLIGRCDEELANNVLKDYGSYFMKLRRAPYEAYLNGRKEDISSDQAVVIGELPWPYNLLSAVFGADEVHDIISTEHEADIVNVIKDNLNEQQSAYTLAYYRDGYTYSKIAKLYGKSVERVRQVIAKSLHIIKHRPDLTIILRYGNDIAEKTHDIRQKLDELTAKEKEIEQFEESLSVRHAKMVLLQEVLNRYSEETAKITTSLIGLMDDGSVLPTDKKEPDVCEMPIEWLGLSTRALHCLWHEDIKTVGDLIKNSRKKVLRFYKLGKKTLEEIELKLALHGLELSSYPYY